MILVVCELRGSAGKVVFMYHWSALTGAYTLAFGGFFGVVEATRAFHMTAATEYFLVLWW